MRYALYLFTIMFLIAYNSQLHAQNGVGYENIFSLKHNQIANPKENTLYIYKIEDNNWIQSDSLKLPQAILHWTEILDGFICSWRISILIVTD